jgi:hypothetical protein
MAPDRRHPDSPMRPRRTGARFAGASLLLLSCLTAASGQTWSLHGQASGWLTSNPERDPFLQAGLRYIPELSVVGDIGGGLAADLDASFNGSAAGHFARYERAEFDGSVKPYRAWLRVASQKLEIRAGLQKINFGSATLFRPLMWFDRVDPRDPLQLTDGVVGALARYYLLDNTNIWLWGLYGNDAEKGWESAPTGRHTVEFGGRFQRPFLGGEAGLSYHHRRADISAADTLPADAAGGPVPEDRFGLDGKWDIGAGVWLEAVLTRRQADLPAMRYQRQWTLGADYTFDVGSGLTALAEFFRSETPKEAFNARADGISFSALSLAYPLGIVDRVSAILYLDWTDHDWYRLLSWQRTYDNWVIYILGFWNPDTVRISPAQSGDTAFAGTGFQLVIVFNH